MSKLPSASGPAPYRNRPGGRVRLAPVLLCLPLVAAPAIAAAQVVDVTQMSLEQLLDVTIIGASKYEQRQDAVAAAVSVITRDEIKAFGWRTVSEILASLPGIYTTYDRQYTYLGTRGFGLPGDFNTRILLAVNGNRVNEVVYDSASFDRVLPVDIDLIERIEFIPGPGGAVYGQNALFGVVNVVTRSGAGVDGTELAGSYQIPQSARQGRATWGKTLDNGLDVLVSATAYKSDGEDLFFEYPGATEAPHFYANESGVAYGMDGEEDKELFASLARGPWSFDLSYGDRRKDDPTATYLSEPLVSGQYQRDRYLVTQLQYQDSYADETLHLLARLFLGRHRYTGQFSYGTPYSYKGFSDWQGVEVRLLSTTWAGHKLMIGMEYQDNSRRDQSNEDQIDPANNVLIAGSGWRLGVYAQDELALSETLTATLGLRFDSNDVTDNEWSPRAALIWKASPNTTVKGLYGRAHRAPNAYEADFEDAVSQVANPSLEGESIDTLELVIDQRVRRNLNVRASLYHWNMRGLVTLGTDPLSGLSQYQSGEDIEANGVELSADTTWDWGGRLRGSLSYQDVAYASGAGLDNSPRFLGKLNLSGPLAATGLRFGYELQYTSERQAIDGSDLDGYWLSNLQLSSDTWVRGLEVSLGLYNLFDTRYEHPGADSNWQNALEQDGRSARLKLSYRF